ncbi:inositol 1, 3, 4-trisphosphate 5/6-kinase, partial [Opisthorchis viverrini]
SADLRFVKIDPHLPIDGQGPFDVILHKLSDLGDEDLTLHHELESYVFRHPEVICIDPLSSVCALADRYDQCRVLSSSLNQSTLADTVFVPGFCLAKRNSTDENLKLMLENGIRFPLICKQLSTESEPNTRKMALVFNARGLEALNYPILLQQFVNHDARLFKLFVIGKFVHIRLRPSIRNLSPSSSGENIFFESNTISKEYSVSPLNVAGAVDNEQTALSMQQRSLLLDIARQLRTDLKLDLFGIDVVECICEDTVRTSTGACGDPNVNEKTTVRYAVIDVNPAPGYSGVPNFPEHLENLIREKLSLPLIPVPSGTMA